MNTPTPTSPFTPSSIIHIIPVDQPPWPWSLLKPTQLHYADDSGPTGGKRGKKKKTTHPHSNVSISPSHFHARRRSEMFSCPAAAEEEEERGNEEGPVVSEEDSPLFILPCRQRRADVSFPTRRLFHLNFIQGRRRRRLCLDLHPRRFRLRGHSNS